MLRKVQTENGMVQGLVGKDPRVTVFRGVPYAEPPVGELRWKAPRPAWDWEGVRKCYEYGDMPMMRIHPGTDDGFYKKELHPVAAEYGMSEDCLYLNIFSPAETREDKLPVFCYIHGGGLQDGYNYEVEFDGERVARRGVIVVMISYRLGLFGFLAHPEITAETPEGEVVSNFGMQDQSLALHWVARNIKNFGGDPERIVICGQCADAAVQSDERGNYRRRNLPVCDNLWIRRSESRDRAVNVPERCGAVRGGFLFLCGNQGLAGGPQYGRF